MLRIRLYALKIDFLKISFLFLFPRLKICLIHATSLVRCQSKDAEKANAYIKEVFMLSYYAEKIRS